MDGLLSLSRPSSRKVNIYTILISNVIYVTICINNIFTLLPTPLDRAIDLGGAIGLRPSLASTLTRPAPMAA